MKSEADKLKEYRKDRFAEDKKKMMEEERDLTICAMKNKIEQERAEEIRSYAEPMLEAHVQRAPRQPLSQAQIEHAVVTAEIARRAMAAQPARPTAETLAQVSARPNAQLRQENLEQALGATAPMSKPPRL